MVWFFQGVRFLGGPFISQAQGPGLSPVFRTMAIVLFVLYLFHKADQISKSKHLNRSKSNSHFLEEVKRKSEDDFGNSIGNKNTRSSEMKSKFQRKNKNNFQKQKRKAKVPHFQESSLAFQMRTVGKYGVS